MRGAIRFTTSLVHRASISLRLLSFHRPSPSHQRGGERRGGRPGGKKHANRQRTRTRGEGGTQAYEACTVCSCTVKYGVPSSRQPERRERNANGAEKSDF